ncbi:MAG: N-acetyltransferase [Lachnospiraceae bacterium]|nr:N-acetyltransferase [Lachnospiraceae bacterium]
MNKDINIRLETDKDYKIVEKLTFEAFETVDFPGQKYTIEHFFAYLLRKDASFVHELDFVAEDEEEIVGNIMYNTINIKVNNCMKNNKSIPENDVYSCEHISSEKNIKEVLSLALLSVLPKFHSMGIGGRLIENSLKKAKDLGYKAMLLPGGYPEYYTRFGFKPASFYGFKWLDGSELDAFMALELEEGYLGRAGGKWKLADFYNDLLDEEKFREYQIRFNEY